MANKSITEKMEEYIQYLPTKDRKYGLKFIKNREFINLRDLVSSVLKKIELNYVKDRPNTELINIRVDKLEDFLVHIDEYLVLLGEDLSIFNTDDDYIIEDEDEW